MLVVEGLQVGYGGAAVLHGVDIRVEAGELVAVVGPNGAGKSTLLRTISGLIKPSAGSITFEGDDLLAIEPDQIVKRGLIQVPEGRMVLGRMSVHENLLLGAHARPRQRSGHLTAAPECSAPCFHHQIPEPAYGHAIRRDGMIVHPPLDDSP